MAIRALDSQERFAQRCNDIKFSKVVFDSLVARGYKTPSELAYSIASFPLGGAPSPSRVLLSAVPASRPRLLAVRRGVLSHGVGRLTGCWGTWCLVGLGVASLQSEGPFV